jgi:hypothetical protein
MSEGRLNAAFAVVMLSFGIFLCAFLGGEDLSAYLAKAVAEKEGASSTRMLQLEDGFRYLMALVVIWVLPAGALAGFVILAGGTSED